MVPLQNSPSSTASQVSSSFDLLVLVMAFGVLAFFRLGSYPLSNPDEGRYAEIAREMVATGDYVTPRLNGVKYFEKPPLVYWTTALCLKVFGPSEWSTRLTPALFAIGGVLLTYSAARKLYDRKAGLLAAAVLGTSLLYVSIARLILLDMPVSVLMAATLFCFILGVREPPGARRRWLFYGLYASAALATMTKGLIGFLVTGAVMFFWLLIFNQWKRLRPLYLPSGSALFLLIAAPWHVLAARYNDTWAHRYFVFEHWERFTTPAASRPGPWHYYVWVLLGGLFPWTGFLWQSTRDAVRGGWARRTENAEAWFFITWAAFIFLFFSASHSKLIAYILPVFPALAVIIGAWLVKVLKDNEHGAARLRNGLRVFSFCSGLVALALCVVVAKPELARLTAEQGSALRIPAFAMTATLILGAIITPRWVRTRGARAGVAGIAATMVLFFALLSFAVPNIPKPGTRSLAEIVTARAKPEDRVMHYHAFFYDFTFYTKRLVNVVAFKDEFELEEDPAARASGRFMKEGDFRRAWAGSARVWAVGRSKDVKALFEDASFHYYLVAEIEDHCLFTNQP